MSANKTRKAGQPIIPQPRLRLIPSPEKRPRPEPDPEQKEMLDDMKRRYRVQRERIDIEDDGKDAA